MKIIVSINLNIYFGMPSNNQKCIGVLCCAFLQHIAHSIKCKQNMTCKSTFVFEFVNSLRISLVSIVNLKRSTMLILKVLIASITVSSLPIYPSKRKCVK